MLNRIFIGVLVILFILLGYFGFKQMQMATQLQSDLDSKNQQMEALKQSNIDLSTAKATLEKKVQDLNSTLQNNAKDLDMMKANLATEDKTLAQLTAENKQLQTKLASLQSANQKLEAEKKAQQSKYYSQTQQLEAKIKNLSMQLQNPQGTTAMPAPAVADPTPPPSPSVTQSTSSDTPQEQTYPAIMQTSNTTANSNATGIGAKLN